MKRSHINRMLIIGAVLAALTGAAVFLYLQNNTLTIERFTINLPENIAAEQTEESAKENSVKIVHLSDLHNKGFGEDQQKLLSEIASLEPDLILFTGDLVDSRRNGGENAIILMSALSEKYPVYTIMGNHDFSDDGYKVLTALENTQVKTLRNESDMITINEIPIRIHGVDDPIRHSRSMRDHHYKEDVGISEPDYYNVLLAHRPEYFSLYTESGHDLVLSGHAHGGQIRLPFVGGLFSPHQGLFPQYYQGMHTASKQDDVNGSSDENVSMIVSRGLGNSLFPFRVFNYPQIVFIELVK